MAETVTTFCRICEAQCGLVVTRDNNRIIAIEPDTEHVVSRGYACIKGLTFEDFRTSPDRITQPLKRIGDNYHPISWEQAIEEIGNKVRELRRVHGDDSVGLYFGNPISFSPLMPLAINGFVRGLKTRKSFTTASLDCNNKFVVSDRMYGAAMALTFPDVDHTKFLMIIGGNPAISKMSFINLPHPVARLKAIEERGGRVVFVNPRRTESAKACGEQVFIRPDTDVYFLLSFLHEIFARKAFASTRIDPYMDGFSTLQTVAQDWPPEKTADVTGISADTLRELVTAYLAADGASLYGSTGINQGSNGTVAFWLIEVINAITGNLDRRGASLMGEGLIDYAALMAKQPMNEKTSRIGGVQTFLESLSCGLMADEILTPGYGQTRAMFVISGNPLLTATNSAKLEQAFKQLDLLVSIDLVRNETANHAHYILPGTHFAERPDIPFMFSTFCGLMPKPWYQFTDALVQAPGNVRNELWTIAQLAQACRAPLFGSWIVQGLFMAGGWLQALPLLGAKLPDAQIFLLDLLSRAAKMGPLKYLRRAPHGIRLKDNAGNNYLGKRVVTKNARVQLSPPEFVQAVQQRVSNHFVNDQKDIHAPLFRLITKRERFSHNSWAHNHTSYIKGDRHSNYLYMHPDDAARLGLQQGDEATVTSSAGSVTLPVHLTDDMMPSAVAMPHGWGHQHHAGQTIAASTNGVNANLLAADGPDAIEPLSGMVQFNGIRVRINKTNVVAATATHPASHPPVAMAD
ncbi:MAG TPA: molybdopterin-dependent oxidoreductase [Pseudomonadales bacterium]|nr:molybdopterin-dependent oxidoreductase [Pseudomonadales bacterium]